MKKISMSEYDPNKTYPKDTVFVLDETPVEIPIPQFLKDKKKREGEVGMDTINK